MITNLEIRKALVDFLRKQTGLSYEVHFNRNEDSEESYFYVDFSEQRETVDSVYYDREIDVNVSLVLKPDKYDRINLNILRSAADSLANTLKPIFYVQDRFITIHKINTRILDSILHFDFKLEFTDYLPEPEGEPMGELELNMGYKNIKEEGQNAE